MEYGQTMETFVQNQQPPEGQLRSPGWSRGELLLLCSFLLLLAGFRTFNLSSYDVLSADGTSYGPIGREFFKHGDFRIFGFISGPGYSFFVGLFDLLLHDIERSLRLVSVVFSTLTVGVVYAMGRAFFSRPSAIAAAGFCATLPFLHGMSGIDITEPTFTFFLLAGAFSFWQAYTAGSSRLAVVAGFLLVAAYLTRSEGFITWFALSVFALLDLVTRLRRDGRRLLVRVLVPFWLAFMLFFAPYLVYLHSMTGEWHLSGKAAGNAQVIKAYLGQTAEGVDVKFKFDKSGSGFDTAKGEGLGKFFRENPELFLFNLKQNWSDFVTEFPQTMPWYLLLAAAGAFVAVLRRRRSLPVAACLVSICAPLVIYFLFFVQQRGFYPYVSALCVLAGAGICLPAGSPAPGRPNRRSLLPLLVAVPLSLYYLYQDFPRPKPPYQHSQDGARLDDKHIGQHLKKLLPPDAVIMTRFGRIAFYAERPMVIPPQESYADVIAYARKNHVTHLVINSKFVDMRPQLSALYGPLLDSSKAFVPPPEVKLVFMGQELGGLPYLVYELLPETKAPVP